jgi:hypothetical protein
LEAVGFGFLERISNSADQPSEFAIVVHYSTDAHRSATLVALVAFLKTLSDPSFKE